MKQFYELQLETQYHTAPSKRIFVSLTSKQPWEDSHLRCLCILHIFSQDSLASWRKQARVRHPPEIPEAMHTVVLFLHVKLVFMPTHVISQTDKEDFTSHILEESSRGCM